MVFPDMSIFSDKLGPMFEKYSLKPFAISFKSVIVFSLYKNSSGKSVEFFFLLSFSSIVAHVFLCNFFVPKTHQNSIFVYIPLSYFLKCVHRF